MHKKGNEETCKKRVIYENGKVYFSREAERKIFFALTLIMLLTGILSKLGLI